MVRNTPLRYSPVLFITLLGVMKLALLLRIRAVWQQTIPEHVPGAVDFSYLGADYPREFPMAPLRSVETFIEDSIHYQLNGTAADMEWETLFPGKGLVVLGPHEDIFSISMFHQLRCLNVIRNAIMERSGIWGYSGSSDASELGHHFVNYLRQMVLCRASMHLDDVIGWGKPEVFSDVYECKDWDMVYSAVKENQRIHSKHRIFQSNGY
ncbi:hypothetical protein EDD18DRAFT_1377008 [Armillaria luteobubalina]|uniref:Uncharacterized protein n=1 Tax=Armillaria luteobubalina TaxID=153913 RepID=A0AA39QA81_9AGAR|nr:hypothetical protein EDD18DRAFT_1377008 [Armillaria luteobubalina]